MRILEEEGRKEAINEGKERNNIFSLLEK